MLSIVLSVFIFHNKHLWSFSSSLYVTLCDTQNKHQALKSKNKKHYSYKHHSSTIFHLFTKTTTNISNKKSLLLHIFCHLNVNQKSSALHSSNQSQLKELFYHIYVYDIMFMYLCMF